jgi:hypothetical protein
VTKSEKREAVKTVENATLFSDGTILLKNVRASYPHLFKASAFEGGEPSFSVKALLPKGTHDKAKKLLDGEIAKLLAEKKLKVAADRLFLRDGDAGDKADDAGSWTVSAREKKRPVIRDRAKQPVDSENASMFYGGCWINVLIRPWAQDNKFGKRVNANLVAVQFVKDDEPFGEGRIGEDEIDDTFEEIEGVDDGPDDI